MNSLQQLHQTLKQRNHSLTQSREIVFAALLKGGAQTMPQLITACKLIDRASVYRTIDLFEELGVVRRIQIGWKYKLELAGAYSHHHHLTCLQCGQIIHFAEDKLLESRLADIAESNNFTIQDHQLEIQGLCKACKKSEIANYH